MAGHWFVRGVLFWQVYLANWGGHDAEEKGEIQTRCDPSGAGVVRPRYFHGKSAQTDRGGRRKQSDQGRNMGFDVLTQKSNIGFAIENTKPQPDGRKLTSSRSCFWRGAGLRN